MPFSWPTSRFVKWFGKYDEHVLKPILIRRYKKEDDVVKHISPMQLTEEAFIPPGSTR